ncbi:MAG TPA: AMMECR1 domain-containing protein, partial [Pseudonocardiaceae bacterium]
RGAAPEDVVLASVRTAQQLARTPHREPRCSVADCAIAVTFFSALEECAVGELDNDRYGIVVRSRERAPRMGGALPRMPGIANEWEQFRHAWQRNAALLPFEPFRLYRHDVEKVVEPGADWQPTGTPVPDGPRWQDSPELGALATRARDRVLRELGRGAPAGVAARSAVCPPQVGSAFVTVYANGRIAGCAGGFGADIEASLDDFAAAAVHDGRFDRPGVDDTIAVSVSLLFNRHEIGEADPEWVVRPTRFADQALQVRQHDRMGIVLPFVAVTSNLTPLGYVREVIDKAGITRPPYRWTRYDCVTWLADAHRVHRLRRGLPAAAASGSAPTQLRRLRDLLTGYTRHHHVGDGEPVSRYEVFADRVRTGVHPARAAYGAWIKARAGLRREAAEDLARFDRGRRPDGWIDLGTGAPTISELAFVILARAELAADPSTYSANQDRLWAQIDLHGRFGTHRDPAAADPAYQDYAPGQALLALAATHDGSTDHQQTLRRALRHYRMRFRQNHHWGAVAWLTQAFAAWGLRLRDPSLTAFGYEIADWALQFQSLRTGAFLNDHQSDAPGATTALYLEGLAAARAAAEVEGAAVREQRYRSACERAVTFLDQLVYQERDRAVLPNPDAAFGGIRTSLTASEVRTDYVHHALGATLSLHALLEQPGESP